MTSQLENLFCGNGSNVLYFGISRKNTRVKRMREEELLDEDRSGGSVNSALWRYETLGF